MFTSIVMTLFAPSHVQLAKSIYALPRSANQQLVVEALGLSCEIDSPPTVMEKNVATPIHVSFNGSSAGMTFDGDIVPGRQLYLAINDGVDRQVFCLVEWR